MSVPILDASAWREFRGKPANAGINETTHLAKVADGWTQRCGAAIQLLKGGGVLASAGGSARSARWPAAPSQAPTTRK